MWNSKQSNGKSWTGAGDSIEKQSKETQNYKKDARLTVLQYKVIGQLYILQTHVLTKSASHQS